VTKPKQASAYSRKEKGRPKGNRDVNTPNGLSQRDPWTAGEIRKDTPSRQVMMQEEEVLEFEKLKVASMKKRMEEYTKKTAALANVPKRPVPQQQRCQPSKSKVDICSRMANGPLGPPNR
jgi:hypothetical protein